MRKLFALGALLFLVSGAILLSRSNPPDPASWVELGGQRYNVEVARTHKELEQGLMFRKHLPEKHGMLFIFPQEIELGFWMKNTLIPLDILYFDRQGVLIDQKRDTPPCTQDPCPNYPSAKPTQYVLEINAGQSAILGMQPGDKIKFAPGIIKP